MIKMIQSCDSFTQNIINGLQAILNTDCSLELVFITSDESELASFACDQFGLSIGKDRDIFYQILDPDKLVIPGFVIAPCYVNLVEPMAEKYKREKGKTYPSRERTYFVFKYVD